MTNKNFDEKTLAKANEEFIAESKSHGEKAREHFARVISYTIRTGNLAIINRLFTGLDSNGGDKLAFVAGYRHFISIDGVAAMLPEGEDRDEIFQLMAAASVKTVNLFKMTDKGVEHSKDNPIVKAYKKALTATYKTDEEMVSAMAPIFVKSNSNLAKRATEEFKADKYLRAVIDTIIRKDANSEETKKLAAALNNVIRANFSRDAAYTDKDIADKLAGKETEEQRKDREAFERLQKKGVKMEFPKPEKIIDHTPAEKSDGNKPAGIEGRENRKAANA